MSYAVDVLSAWNWTVYDDHDQPVPGNAIRLMPSSACCEYQTLRLRAHATAWEHGAAAVGLDVTDRVTGTSDGTVIVTTGQRVATVTGECNVTARTESSQFPGVWVDPTVDAISVVRTVVATDVSVFASDPVVGWSSDDDDEIKPELVDEISQVFDRVDVEGKAYAYASFASGVVMDVTAHVELTALNTAFLEAPTRVDGHWRIALRDDAFGDATDGSPMLHAVLRPQCASSEVLAEANDTLCINLPAPTPAPTPVPVPAPTLVPSPAPTNPNVPYELNSLQVETTCTYLHAADVKLSDAWTGVGTNCTSVRLQLYIGTRNDRASSVQTVGAFEASTSGFDLDGMLEWNVTSGAHLVSARHRASAPGSPSARRARARARFSL